MNLLTYLRFKGLQRQYLILFWLLAYGRLGFTSGQIQDGNLFRTEPLEKLFCLRCNRELEAGQKSVAVYMFAQTVGIRPRQKSAARRICFCPQCSVSLAMGPPPEGALNVAAWIMIRDLVGADPALNQAAWESLRGLVGLLPASENDNANRLTGTDGYFEF